MLLAGGKAPPGSELYTSGSGNFTVPVGIFSITYSIVGGGGGGSSGYQIGGVNNNYDFSGLNGGAGGGAGRLLDQTLSVTPGDVIAYSVGAAGSNGGGPGVQGGTDGGTTTFGAFTATGGGRGNSYSASGGGGNPGDRTGGTGAAGTPGGFAGTQPTPYPPNGTNIGVPQGGAGAVVNGVTYGRGGIGGPANPNAVGQPGLAGVVYVSWD